MGDSFASRVALTGNTGSVTVDNTGYTMEAGEPDVGGILEGSAWFSFTPGFDGVIFLHTNDTVDTSLDTVLAVYTGSAVNALTEVASSDDDGRSGTAFSQVFVTVLAGVEYQVQVGTWAGDVRGAITLAWAYQANPASITDSFNRADGLGLGNTDGVVSMEWSTFDSPGSAVTHKLGIGSNQAKNYRNYLDEPAAGISQGQAIVHTNSSDGTVSFTIGPGALAQAAGAALFRWSNSANYWSVSATSPTTASIAKVVGNVGTVPPALAVSGLDPYVDGDEFAAEFNGDQISLLKNGVVIAGPHTDTFNQTQVSHGFALDNVEWLDNWSFTWPGEPPTQPLRVVSHDASQIWRVTASVNPDGGLLRLVEADGTRWKQSTTGTRPLTVVGPDGSVLTTLPMAPDT